MVKVLGDPVRRLTFAFALSQMWLTATLVVATSLQTRAPTGKNFGPDVGLLLSRPMTFHVSGVTVRFAKAGNAKMKARTTHTNRRLASFIVPRHTRRPRSIVRKSADQLIWTAGIVVCRNDGVNAKIGYEKTYATFT